MSGNWKVNAGLGLTAFLLTFCFSCVNNTWFTSLFRAGIGFLAFFLFSYIFRFALAQILSKKNSGPIQKPSGEEMEAANTRQESPGEKAELGEPSFQAIPLNALHSFDEEIDPEKIGNTILAWTKQD